MRKVLVLGGTGLVGRRLTETLLREGFAVRCSVRNPERARQVLPAACEIVRGDIGDLRSMQEATRSVEAVYNTVHTLSAQKSGSPNGSFVDAELAGLEHIVAACRENGVRRMVYLTFLGIAPDGPTEWARGRWKAEQLLLHSGLDATVLRPAQIVGKGGFGFDSMMAQARRRVTPVLGSGKGRHRNIALDDLVHYMVRVLDEPRTSGKAFDVGCDDVLTADEMIDTAARVLGKAPPRKVHVPLGLLRRVAPLIERAAKLPRGAFRDLAVGMDLDMVGDPRPLRELIPHEPLRYAQAIERALQGDESRLPR